MVIVIQKLAKISALLAFFIILLTGILTQDLQDVYSIIIVIFKASIGGMFFWILGIVISDIALKGLIDAVDLSRDSKWEGGLITRFVEEKERVSKPEEAEQEIKIINVETTKTKEIKK